MSDVRLELFRHHLWATERLLDTCERLAEADLDASVPGVYGTIRATLVHMIASETRYLASMRNQPQPEQINEHKPFPGFTALRAAALQTGNDLVAMVEAAGPNDRMRGENRGERYDLPLSIPFAQVINHGTEHRTNITTVMTARGLAAPKLDVWQYAREVCAKG
jgi:uncharacterized damage-inducible protein DinB